MPTPTTTPTSAAFAGWHLPGGREPWRKVCEAATEDECWALLLAAAERGDKCVTPASADPNDRPADRRRRRY
jgi:hypothetical protein